MVKRKRSRKKAAVRRKAPRFNPTNRAIERRVIRQKNKAGYPELKYILYIVTGFALAFTLIIVLYNFIKSHQGPHHH